MYVHTTESFIGKGGSIYKPRVVFVVIHEIKEMSRFFKFHESLQNQHVVYKLRHF